MTTQPLKPREKQLLQILAEYAGADRTSHYLPLRQAGVPERIAKIYNSKAEFLDSLMHREMQGLERKGWIILRQSVFTILHEPDSK